MRFFYAQLAVVFVVFLPGMIRAQHYLPEVCLHDAAQRMFPIEAARVMAWITNEKVERVAEVTWKVAGEINGRSEWQIGWKSRQGEEIASAAVTYDADKLNVGAEYFRAVWSQLAQGLKFEAGKNAGAVQELEAAFWRGSARAGVTRMSAVVNAQSWLNQSSVRSKAQDAAELAGLLAQGAVPVLGGSCTLDYLMLARAAAWLCHAETLTGTALTREWCVIAHLGGREIAASRAWKEAKDAASQDAACWRWWDKILTNYPMSVKDVGLFATIPGQTEGGLPFLLSHLRFETGASKALENIVAELYGHSLLSQPDYAPLMINWFVMGRMRGRCLQMAQKSQREWLEVMALQRQPGADELASEAADAADAALAAMSEDEGVNVPIQGLAATGKVVELGMKAHSRKLRPQAAVSAEEILLYGWESSLLVWRGVFKFYDQLLGLPDVSAALVKNVRTAAPSLVLMMRRLNLRQPETGFPLTWLEYLEDAEISGLVIHQKGRNTAKKGDPGVALQFLRNCMKRGPTAYDQWRSLFPSFTGEVNSTRLAEMMLKQSSENTIAYACKFYNISLPEHVRLRFKELGVTLFERTRKASPNALLLQREMLAAELQASSAPALEAAQKLEAHYWLAPGGDYIAQIMEKYVEANAPQAAARFYTQALEVDGGSLSFSNTEALMRWALAWLEGDKSEMAAADKHAPSYSSRDLEKHALQALCTGDLKRVRQTGEAALQRYGPAPSATNWLLSMLPFLDALKDQDSPQHLEAQSHFMLGGDYPHMQFVILRELDTPRGDCIKLVGGGSQRAYIGLLSSYWQGNAPAFQKELAALKPYQRTQMPPIFKMILAHMKAELLKLPKVDSPDLKPAHETRLDEVVREAMNSSGRPNESLR